MLCAVIGSFDSLREVVISLLSSVTKLSHLSINYSAMCSTLVDANKRRASSFSNMTSFIRGQLMSYINLYSFLNDPEKIWREKNEAYKREMQLASF